MQTSTPAAPSAAARNVLRGLSPIQRDTLVVLAASGSRAWFRIGLRTRQALMLRNLVAPVDGGGQVPNSLGLEVVEAEKARRTLVVLERRIETGRLSSGPELEAKLAELRVRAGK